MKWTQTCVIGGEVHVTSWLSDSSMLREVKSEWKWSCRTQKCRTSIRLTGVLMHQFCWILTSRPVVRRRLPHLLLSTQHWRLQTHCINSYSRWVNECGWILVLELMTELSVSGPMKSFPSASPRVSSEQEVWDGLMEDVVMDAQTSVKNTTLLLS